MNTSSHERPPQDCNADVAVIRKNVLEHLDSGRNVVLVVHSYAGTVGSEAVKGLGRKYKGGQDSGGSTGLFVPLCSISDIGFGKRR